MLNTRSDTTWQMKNFTLPKEGYNDLVNEHENLVHKVRQEVIVELQEAQCTR